MSDEHKSQRKAQSYIQAHVDPTKEIRVRWVDGIPSKSGESCWVTQCRVPLGTTPPGNPIAADVRVGRRWVI